MKLHELNNESFGITIGVKVFSLFLLTACLCNCSQSLNVCQL